MIYFRVLLKTFLAVIGTVFVFKFYQDMIVIPAFDYRGALKFANDRLLDSLQDRSPPLLVLGDSATKMAISPIDLHADALNLAIHGSDPRLSLHIFEMVLRKSKGKPRCLLVGSSYAYNLPYRDSLFFKVHIGHGYYGLRAAMELYDLSLRDGGYPANAISRPHYLLKAILSFLRISSFDPVAFQNSLNPFYWYRSYASMAAESIELHGISLVRGTVSEDAFYAPLEYFSETFHPEQTFDSYIERIIQTAGQNSIAVFFPIMPVFATQKGAHILKYINDLTKHMSQKEARFSNFKVITTHANLKKSDFYTFNHLNIDGALKYTNQIKKQLPVKCFR